MHKTQRFDSLIQYWWEDAARKYVYDGPVVWLLGKAQVEAESQYNPKAMSQAGARGILQIMSGTWGPGFLLEWNNPDENLRVGFHYLFKLWKMFADEDGMERWKFALGAYNCGPGWIIKAQALLKARARETNLWINIASVLPSLTGKHSQETIRYVDRIIKRYDEMTPNQT